MKKNISLVVFCIYVLINHANGMDSTSPTLCRNTNHAIALQEQLRIDKPHVVMSTGYTALPKDKIVLIIPKKNVDQAYARKKTRLATLQSTVSDLNTLINTIDAQLENTQEENDL